MPLINEPVAPRPRRREPLPESSSAVALVWALAALTFWAVAIALCFVTGVF